MSYYRGSMSIRGRGHTSFRGSNSYRGGTSNYRGGSNSYRGSNSYGDRGGGYSRGGRYHSSNSYSSSGYNQESRSRYSNSGEKYNSRGRDDGYRRSSYRAEESYSSSRDHSRGSPDRKRIRTDQGSSSRRSNDGNSYTNTSSGDGYNHQRYDSFVDHRRNYSGERHARSSPKDFRSSYNKTDSSSMPPPISSASRPRGSYRGRGLRSRGGAMLRRTSDMFAARTTKRVSDMYTKRRIVSMRSFDYARRLKIQKMRSAIKKRDSASSNESEKEDWDAEMEEAEKKKQSEEKDDSPKKASPKKEKPAKPTTSGDEATDKEDNGEQSADEGQAGEQSDKDAEEETSPKTLPNRRYSGRPFIKLTCTHCASKCVTFKEYILHLRSSRHINAMRRLAIKQKGQLARMRLFQRNAQRELDEKNKDVPGLRTQFCPVCKLNYRQLKAKHQMSEAHREMKKFLMPYCRICKITFRSPMLYEAHLCALEHIKRKARIDFVKNSKVDDEDQGSGDEGIKELDLDNFMTLDSVGDVDDDDIEDDDEADGVKKESSETDKPKTPKPEINVGNEHVRKVEVYYCELCKMYLPRHEELESALKKHCRTRSHLQKYVRYRDDKALRREAERIHRKIQESKEAKEAKEAKEKEGEKLDESTTSTPKKEKDSTSVLSTSLNTTGRTLTENGSVDEEDAVDEKLWADVDKDLGDLLREVEPNKSSDDEDDSRATSVRYDRFRYSDKKGVEEKGVKLDESKNDDETAMDTSDIKDKTDEK